MKNENGGGGGKGVGHRPSKAEIGKPPLGIMSLQSTKLTTALHVSSKPGKLVTWSDQRRAALLERQYLCFRRMNSSNALPMGGDDINFHSAD